MVCDSGRVSPPEATFAWAPTPEQSAHCRLRGLLDRLGMRGLVELDARMREADPGEGLEWFWRAGCPGSAARGSVAMAGAQSAIS